MLHMFGSLLWRKKKTLGQTVAEYALIVALVAIASIAMLTLFGNQLRGMYRYMIEQLAGNSGGQKPDYSGQAGGAEQKGLSNW